MSLKVLGLSCEFRSEALGIESEHPLLQWKLESEDYGAAQMAYRACVASAPALLDAPDLWDSGRVESGENHAVYGGPALESNRKAYWRVRVWDAQGNCAASEVAWWRQGVRAADWVGGWIGFDEGRDAYDPSVPYYCADDFDKGENHPFLPKPALLRSEFAARGEVLEATLYVSAMGLTELYLNGEKAVRGHMVPGICDFRKRAHYFAYDVGGLVRRGKNALSAVLADGWYAGYIGLNPRQWWGAKPRLNAQLHIRYADGGEQIVFTDGRWRAATGPWLYADIMHGTGYDATREPAGWKLPGYDDSGWKAADTGAEYDHIPCAHPGVPIVEHARYAPVSVRRIGADEAIVDFGCCFSGVICARLRGPRGAKVDFYHAEELERDGSELHYFGNRSAQAHDCYILSGEGEERFQPEFTYHGFRYVHIYGLERAELLQIEGVAISSELPDPTLLVSGNDTVNEVIQLIRNTQQSNLYDMPTDVCARDERLGWGCEGHLFMHTAAALNNNAQFLRKWLRDALDGQREDGAIWAIAPAVMMRDIEPFMGDLQSDIALNCAWLLMRCYNDLGTVGRAYDALERYMEYSVRNSDRLLRFATARDWLDLSHGGRSDFDHGYGKCDPTLVGTAWFARGAEMMAEISQALGRDDRTAHYQDLHDRIRRAFRTFFLGRDKLLRGATQGGYMLAAAFGLIEGKEIDAARSWVVSDMEARGGVSWGTATTPVGLFGLCRLGLEAEAAAFVRRRAYPSIGYMADCGATAVWERWDAIYEGRFHPHAMNAFDHIGLATVGEWILAGLAGIQSASNGYARVRVQPVFDREIGFMRAAYQSVHGAIRVEWSCAQGEVFCAVELPVGCEGELVLPCEERAIRVVRGGAFTSARRCAGGGTAMNLTSGRYEFIMETQK